MEAGTLRRRLRLAGARPSKFQSAVLFRFPDCFSLLYDERLHAGVLLLNAIGKTVWAVLKQHNKAKSQDDEQSEPKEAPQERHAKRLARAEYWINTTTS